MVDFKLFRKKEPTLALQAVHGLSLDELPLQLQGDIRVAEGGYQVFDYLHDSWINFTAGDWICEGPQGEHYPIKADVFESTYEEIK
jgi:hypothetical protein